MATYDLISSSASYAGATTLTFSSIPTTYTDLYLAVSCRGNGYNGTDIYLTFNGSSSSYSGKHIWKDGNSASATTGGSGSSNILAGIIPGSQAGSYSYGSVGIYIPNYLSSSVKNVSIETVSERNGNDQWIFFGTGTWSSSSQINSITLTASSNFLGDSTAYLYGIKNS